MRLNLFISHTLLGIAVPIGVRAQTYEATELYVGDAVGYGISSSGQVTGVVTNSTGTFAFVIDPNTHAMTLLGPRPPNVGTGVAINDSGNVAANISVNSSSLPLANIIDSATNAQTAVGTLGGPFSSAEGINNNNQVAGEAATVAGSYNPSHAFVTNATSGALIDLGTLGGNNSIAFGINSSGQTTGASDITESSHGHAFVTNASTHAMKDLGTLSGDLNSAGNSINASG